MISNSQYLLAGNYCKLLQIRDWFFFQVAFREYNCSCLQEQKFWFCVLLLYTVLAYLYLEWWWLHWNYCPFQHTVEFPFFFLFWDHLLICRLAMCYYHTFQNAIRKLSWSVYLQKLRGIFFRMSLIYFGTSFTWWHQSQHYPAFLLYSKLKGWTTHSSTHLHAISPLGYQLELFFFTSSWTVVLYSLHIYVQCHSV